jgi:hypothetical protein
MEKKREKERPKIKKKQKKREGLFPPTPSSRSSSSKKTKKKKKIMAAQKARAKKGLKSEGTREASSRRSLGDNVLPSLPPLLFSLFSLSMGK